MGGLVTPCEDNSMSAEEESGVRLWSWGKW